MSSKEILSSRNLKEIAGSEKRQIRTDDEWRERRGRTLSVAFDSFDSELGRGGPSLLCEGGPQFNSELARGPSLLFEAGPQFEPPGFTQQCEVSSRETLSGLTRAFEVTGDEVNLPRCAQKELPGYTETQVKPFTVTDTVDAEVNDCAKEKGRSTSGVKKEQKPKTLSNAAVKWVYLQIWIYFYGFRYLLY